MVDRLKFYVDGAWQSPVSKKTWPVVNPATEEVLYEIALGSQEDVDKAVAAARRAFETYSVTTREQRIELCPHIESHQQYLFGHEITKARNRSHLCVFVFSCFRG